MVTIDWDAGNPDGREAAASFEQADKKIRADYPTAFYVQTDINSRVVRTYWPSKEAEAIGDGEEILCVVETGTP